MSDHRLLAACTVTNAVLLVAQLARPAAAPPAAADLPMLRGRGLEIVDDRGQVRASIEVLPPDTSIRMPDGSQGSPATVLFRLRASDGQPHLKLTATDDGAGMVLGGTGSDTYIQLRARGNASTVKLSEEHKAPRVLAP